MSRIKAFVHKIWESLAQRNGWKVKSHSPVHWISALIIEKSKNQSNIQRGIINTVKRLNIVKSYSGISFLKHDMGILMTSSSSRPNVRHKKSSTGAIFREQPCKVNPYQSVFLPAVSNFFLLYHSKPVECKTATYLLCQYLSLYSVWIQYSDVEVHQKPENGKMLLWIPQMELYVLLLFAPLCSSVRLTTARGVTAWMCWTQGKTEWDMNKISWHAPKINAPCSANQMIRGSAFSFLFFSFFMSAADLSDFKLSITSNFNSSHWSESCSEACSSSAKQDRGQFWIVACMMYKTLQTAAFSRRFFTCKLPTASQNFIESPEGETLCSAVTS